MSLIFELYPHGSPIYWRVRGFEEFCKPLFSLDLDESRCIWHSHSIRQHPGLFMKNGPESP